MKVCESLRCLVVVLFLVPGGLSATTNPTARLSVQFDSCRRAIQHSNPEGSMRMAYRELEIANELDNTRMEIQGYIDLGRALREMGKYDFALQSVHRAFLLLSSFSDEELAANANRLTGAIYSELEDFERAMGYLQKASEYYMATEDTIPYLQTLGEIAVVYGRMEKNEECLRALEEVSRCSKDVGAHNLQLIAMLNMAELFCNMHQVERGLNTLERIQWEMPEGFRMENANQWFVMHFFLIKANLLVQAQDYDMAESLYKKGLALSDSLNDFQVKTDFLKGLLSISHKRNDCQQLVSYYQQLHDTEDTLNNSMLRKRITSMEFIYDITRMQTQLDHVQRKMNVQRVLYWILILFIIIVGSYVLLRWKKKLEEKRKREDFLTKELQAKKDSLTKMAIYFHELKQNSCSAIQILKNAEQLIPSAEDKKSLQNSQRQLNQILSGNTEVLGAIIDQQYEDFLVRLERAYPDLNTMERRVCAMLVIGFSSKEMAAVLNCSPGTLDNIRSRIRKKLNISKDSSIAEDLSRF